MKTMNYKVFQSLNFFSSQVPVYVMLIIWFIPSFSEFRFIEGILVFQLLVGILSFFLLIKNINGQKISKNPITVKLKLMTVKLDSAALPVLIPAMVAMLCKDRWLTGFACSVFIQIMMYFLTINSTDYLWNVLLSVMRVNVFKAIDVKSKRTYYCFSKIERLEDEVQCNKFSSGWLVYVNGMK